MLAGREKKRAASTSCLSLPASSSIIWSLSSVTGRFKPGKNAIPPVSSNRMRINPPESLCVDADLTPSVLDRLHFLASVAVETNCIRERQLRKGLEHHVVTHSRVNQGLVPDAARLLPGKASEVGRNEVEGMVRDATVNMHSAVVLNRVDEIPHMFWLWVFAEHWIVICAARVFHRAQGYSLNVGRK